MNKVDQANSKREKNLFTSIDLNEQLQVSTSFSIDFHRLLSNDDFDCCYCDHVVDSSWR